MQWYSRFGLNGEWHGQEFSRQEMKAALKRKVTNYSDSRNEDCSNEKTPDSLRRVKKK